MPSNDSGLMEVGAEAAREGYGLFLGNAVSNVILAVGSIAIARLLGSEGYGVYTLSLVIPSIAVLFTSLGIDQSIIKYASEYSSKNMLSRIRGLFRVSFIFKLVLGVAATVLVFTFSDQLASLGLNRPYMGYLLRLASLLILFQTVYTLCSNLFIGLGRASIAGGLATLQALAKVALIIALLILGFGVRGAVFGHVFGYISAAVIGSILGFSMTRGGLDEQADKPSSSIHFLKSLIVYGFPLYGSTILLTITTQYNNMVLARFASNIEIGSYTAAMNISTIISLMAMPIATVLYPSFSRVEVIDRSRLPKIFELAVRYSILLLAPAAFFVSAFSGEFVEIIYGESFRPAIPYLSLYALFYSVYPLLLVEISYFNGVGLPRKTLMANLVIFMLTLPLSPLLASLLGVIGVILSMIVASSVAMLYATSFLVKRQMISFKTKSLAKIYASAAISVAVSAAISKTFCVNDVITLLAGLILTLTLYITLIPTSSALDEQDYTALKEILGRLRIVGGLMRRIISYAETIHSHLRGA